MKVGVGYDVHRLEVGRKLVLGGIDIPHEMGLLGHSDADVLVHAIADAILGAAGMGDIGTHFPDTDPKYKNIFSLKILEEIGNMINKKKLKVGNIDSTIVAEVPKMAEWIPLMVKRIAKALNLDSTQVNVKAKTEEGLGFSGKGIAAYAVCALLED
mgnify:CR=1 FL=1